MWKGGPRIAVLVTAVMCSHFGGLKAQTAVPFVGCSSDGQAGSVDAPKGSAVVLAISAREAEQLAYYKSAMTTGALAPRGWHCAATYGSGGDALYIVPEPIDPRNMFSSERPKISGPAIGVSRRYGDTSGRFEVAEIISRMFPAYRSFAANVTAAFDLPPFPARPYPMDTIRYKGKTLAEYRTPPQTEGLGTYSWLGKNDRAISGAAMLVGPAPDLLLIAARLPDSLQSLAPIIVARFEHDGGGRPARPPQAESLPH